MKGLLEDMNETVLFSQEELELDNSPRESEVTRVEDTPQETETSLSKPRRKYENGKPIASNGQRNSSNKNGLNGHLEFHDNES